jgi:hypothetical protein
MGRRNLPHLKPIKYIIVHELTLSVEEVKECPAEVLGYNRGPHVPPDLNEQVVVFNALDVPLVVPLEEEALSLTDVVLSTLALPLRVITLVEVPPGELHIIVGAYHTHEEVESNHKSLMWVVE